MSNENLYNADRYDLYNELSALFRDLTDEQKISAFHYLVGYLCQATVDNRPVDAEAALRSTAKFVKRP